MIRLRESLHLTVSSYPSYALRLHAVRKNQENIEFLRAVRKSQEILLKLEVRNCQEFLSSMQMNSLVDDCRGFLVLSSF